jgi:hypothetical protein
MFTAGGHHPGQARTQYTGRMRFIPLLFSACVAVPSLAQAAEPPAGQIGFASVAAALKDLEARDGNGTIVTHADGWTIVNEPMASAQWSFTPSGYYAHPAVVRRTIKRSPDGKVSVETASLCEASEAECSRLLAEFAAMNERITQSLKSRGRQAPSQPPAPQ